ncbi:GNAT family N-acetyltransferase [Sneathiella limimaris]|uniref:GNAT family N-acetyltransferase n=1 Tax=Sneathiella limimaris TaxID=1964213 RepID=UPI00146EDFFC|nr:GNAT family N-acetyltransferase [Sneathiella limimaris]
MGKNVEFVDLFSVEKSKVLSLMNNAEVRRYLPLLSGEFTEKACEDFLLSKKRLWEVNGFGPFAISVDGKFAGWGGLQQEGEDVDFALVLHPDFWGCGGQVFQYFKRQAFEEMDIQSITILLPTYRPSYKALERFGFLQEDDVQINGQIFLRFRLLNPKS